jgi:hypothetical protein
MAKKTNKPRDPNTTCGAQLRKKPGRYCRQPKGYKTPHVGEGRCWLHGGLTPIKSGLHSMVKHGRLKDLISQYEATGQQILDLEPEAKLMKAIIVDFVNRYDDFTDQLETWYNAIDEDRRAEKLPPVPRKFPSLEDAASIIEVLSRIVERIHKMTRDGSITLDVFRTLMSSMGTVVASVIEDEEQLKKIEEGWSQIMVDPRSFIRKTGKDE